MDGFIFLILIAIIALFSLIYKLCADYLKENSPCIKNLLYVNSIQNFKNFKTVENYHKYCNSKSQFDNFNRDNYIMAIVDENYNRYSSLLNDLQYNREKYYSYLSEIVDFKNNYKSKFNFFLKMVEFLEFERLRLNPPIEITVKISVSYTSPKGKNSYYKSCKINSNDIIYYCDECQKARQYKQSAKYQRSLMTDKLRYQVLNRDGYRCVICGACAKDGAKLHVDHIKPVSKGGKTELSNLRTLCDRCNLGKGASYNPNGLN